MVVSVAYDPGLNLLKRLFHQRRDRLRSRVREALGSTPGIRVLGDDETGGTGS